MLPACQLYKVWYPPLGVSTSGGMRILGPLWTYPHPTPWTYQPLWTYPQSTSLDIPTPGTYTHTLGHTPTTSGHTPPSLEYPTPSGHTPPHLDIPPTPGHTYNPWTYPPPACVTCWSSLETYLPPDSMTDRHLPTTSLAGGKNITS